MKRLLISCLCMLAAVAALTAGEIELRALMEEARRAKHLDIPKERECVM